MVVPSFVSTFDASASVLASSSAHTTSGFSLPSEVFQAPNAKLKAQSLLFHLSCWRNWPAIFRATVSNLFGSGLGCFHSQILLVWSEEFHHFFLNQLLCFCAQTASQWPARACPTDEWTLRLCATSLARPVKHSSIRVYLSIVRSLHI